MDLAKCPKCGVSQKLKNIVSLTNNNTKTCHGCGAGYGLVKSKSTGIFIALLLPILLVYYFQPFTGIFNLIAFFAWAVFGIAFYAVKAPLEIKNT